MQKLKKLTQLLNFEYYTKLFSYAKGYRHQILILTIMNMILSVIGVFFAILTKEIIDTAIESSMTQAIKYALVFILLFILEILLNSYVSYKFVVIKTALTNELQLNYMRNLYNKNWLQITKYNTGDLSTRLYDDLSKIVNSITASIPSLIALSVQLILGFLFLAFYDMTLAILILLITPISILFSMIIGTKLKSIQFNIQETESAQWSKTSESISNMTILKTFNYLERNINDIRNIQQKKLKFIKQRSIFRIKANILLDLGYFIGLFAAIVIGAYRLSYGIITFGTLTAFLQLIDRIQMPLEEMSHEIPALISSFSSLDRIDAIYSISDEETSSLKPDKRFQPLKIELSDIDFSYTQEHPVLKGINLTINKGDKIAIIGPSGEGKTTLINILLSLITPDKGKAKVQFNDKKTYPLSSDYRRYFSYVTQTNMLFTGTIKENFLLTSDVSSTEIKKALRVSCCTEFIDKLEDGLDSLILEDGLGLSQGQLQRLSIARALLHNRPFLIFDEATSSLDESTEKKVLDNIAQYYNDLTLIAITHRTQLLSISNRIYRLENQTLTPIINDSCK